MRAKDLVIDEYYRHKDHPNYCFARVIKVINPKEGENTTNKILVKCEYVQNKHDNFGLIKYFFPKDLVK